MKKIKTLLVDDEISALNTLRGMLTEFCPCINIAGEALSIPDALRSVAHIQPELVFLDIEMPPNGTGFDFLKLTEQYDFGVIFTTAYPQHALDAINDVQAWSYLVKPYSIEKLIKAVNVAAKKIADAAAAALSAAEKPGIILPDGRKGSRVLRTLDILYCKSEGATITIYFKRHGKVEKVVHYHTLKDFEAQLAPTLFCRVHHSYIVNLAFVERYDTSPNARIIYLEGGLEIPVSIQKVETFEQKIEAYLQA